MCSLSRRLTSVLTIAGMASLRVSFSDGSTARLAETSPEEIWKRAFERRA
jgi:hypothetical protein